MRSSYAFTPNNNQQKEIVLNCFSVFTPIKYTEVYIDDDFRKKYSKISKENYW